MADKFIKIDGTSGHKKEQTAKDSGIHKSSTATYISGTGTAGTDGVAATLLTKTISANTMTQVGDRMRIRAYWTGDTGAAVTGTMKLGPAAAEILIGHTTDGGAANLQINEAWLHYIDNTHVNIIENENGALGVVSAPNVAGFDFDSDQNLIFNQNAVGGNHIILYALIVDVFPKGVE